MSYRLLSHPNKLLRQHLEEVGRAADLILCRHPAGPFANIGIDVAKVMHVLAGWHDVAKGTTFFQDYIVNPDDFRRRAARGQADERAKTHTPLGSLLVMRQFAGAVAGGDQPRLWGLLIALAVRGHHSGTPTLDDLRDTYADASSLKQQFVALSREVEGCHPSLAGGYGSLLDAGFDDVLDGAEDALVEIEELLAKGMPLTERVRLRLGFQFCFSVLLEADKALLIHKTPEEYLGKAGRNIVATTVEDHPPREGDPDAEINRHRHAAFIEVVTDADTSELSDTRPRLLTLPTGLGKTRCAAAWAFHLRCRIEDATGKRPKIFVVLPYLSIIEQTQDVYRELLEMLDDHTNDATLQTSHSLSARDHQDIENPDEAEFALDTWRSDVVLTTFDQFLLSLMGDRTRHQQRFHNLCDAIVILDEVQGFPCGLWHAVGTALGQMAAVARTRFLLMTATQPALFQAADRPAEVKPVIASPSGYARARYRMEFDLVERPYSLWVEELHAEIAARKHRNKHKWLVILNTRRSAQQTYRFLKDNPPRADDDIFILSSDIVPGDRLERIEQIKDSRRCIAVATQCVEAGVDIDMDHVIRDFAPLDSLVQAAGRCNRNGYRSRATVRIVRLLDEDVNGRPRKPFCDYVYDGPLLDHTQTAVEPFLSDGLAEEQVTQAVESYFHQIVEKSVMALGKNVTECWSRFDHGNLDISRLLRGKQDQVSFVVVKCDSTGTLKDRIEDVWKLDDRWERRRELRRLAPEIANITVSAWKTPKYQPDDVADPFPNAQYPMFWILHDEFYDEEVGLCPNPSSRSGFGIF